MIHKGNVVNLRTSPWYNCLLGELKQDIQTADMDALHTAAEQKGMENGETTEEITEDQGTDSERVPAEPLGGTPKG